LTLSSGEMERRSPDGPVLEKSFRAKRIDDRLSLLKKILGRGKKKRVAEQKSTGEGGVPKHDPPHVHQVQLRSKSGERKEKREKIKKRRQDQYGKTRKEIPRIQLNSKKIQKRVEDQGGRGRGSRGRRHR